MAADRELGRVPRPMSLYWEASPELALGATPNPV
jgi:hypothetical protein